MKAANRYDYRRGNRFSTFAAWWIRQAISRAICDQGHTIRVPVHILELRSRYFRAKYGLLKELGREPLAWEIASKIGINEEKIQAIERLSLPSISLETQVGPDGYELGDFIADENTICPTESLSRQQLLLYLNNAMDDLTDRERKIISMRFGLGDEREHTLEQVGQYFNLSRELVRQIENVALGKLYASKVNYLAGSLDG